MERREVKVEKRKLWRKITAAAALLVIFGAVLFAIPSEQLAWQGPYVMGTLLLPKPAIGQYVRPDLLKESADSSFSFLAFVSVTGVLVLLARKLPDFPRVRRVPHPDLGLKLPIELKIRVMYIL